MSHQVSHQRCRWSHSRAVVCLDVATLVRRALLGTPQVNNYLSNTLTVEWSYGLRQYGVRTKQNTLRCIFRLFKSQLVYLITAVTVWRRSWRRSALPEYPRPAPRGGAIRGGHGAPPLRLLSLSLSLSLCVSLPLSLSGRRRSTTNLHQLRFTDVVNFVAACAHQALLDWLVDWLIDWLIVWSIDRLASSLTFF